MFLYAYRLPYLALNICFGINEKTWESILAYPDIRLSHCLSQG